MMTLNRLTNSNNTDNAQFQDILFRWQTNKNYRQLAAA